MMRIMMVIMTMVMTALAISTGGESPAFWPLIICATIYAVGSGIVREMHRLGSGPSA